MVNDAVEGFIRLNLENALDFFYVFWLDEAIPSRLFDNHHINPDWQQLRLWQDLAHMSIILIQKHVHGSAVPLTYLLLFDILPFWLYIELFLNFLQQILLFRHQVSLEFLESH